MKTKVEEEEKKIEEAAETPAEKEQVAAAKKEAKADVEGMKEDVDKLLLMEDLLDRYLEKIPEASRTKVMEAVKDDPISEKIKFVKKLLKTGVNFAPAIAAGQIPAPGATAKPTTYFDPAYKHAFVDNRKPKTT